MKWHDNYTIDEIEYIMTKMCDWIGEQLDNDYNWGDITDREELVRTYIDMGFHENEVREWYDWWDEFEYCNEAISK